MQIFKGLFERFFVYLCLFNTKRTFWIKISASAGPRSLTIATIDSFCLKLRRLYPYKPQIVLLRSLFDFLSKLVLQGGGRNNLLSFDTL